MYFKINVDDTIGDTIMKLLRVKNLEWQVEKELRFIAEKNKFGFVPEDKKFIKHEYLSIFSCSILFKKYRSFRVKLYCDSNKNKKWQ